MTSPSAVQIVGAYGAWPPAVTIDEARVVSGAPEASTFILDESTTHQVGLWKVTAGEFTTQHPGYLEYIHVLGGRGRLRDDAGNVTELAPGVTVFMPAGWAGRWIVDEPITKMYSIIHTGGAETIGGTSA